MATENHVGEGMEDGNNGGPKIKPTSSFSSLSLPLSLSLSFSLPPYVSLPSNSARQSSRATPSRSGLATTTPKSNPLA
jgi:hypothetical protein